jgi:hypothetical protein
MIEWPESLNPLAVYAAVVATAVFAWDVWKWWHSRARFTVRVGANMTEAPAGFGGSTAPYKIAIEVCNIGSATTTITHVVLQAYPSWLHRLMVWAKENAMVTKPGRATLPYSLQPGDRFLATCEQNDLVVGWSQHYYLYAGVFHTT